MSESSVPEDDGRVVSLAFKRQQLKRATEDANTPDWLRLARQIMRLCEAKPAAERMAFLEQEFFPHLMAIEPADDAEALTIILTAATPLVDLYPHEIKQLMSDYVCTMLTQMLQNDLLSYEVGYSAFKRVIALMPVETHADIFRENIQQVSYKPDETPEDTLFKLQTMDSCWASLLPQERYDIFENLMIPALEEAVKREHISRIDMFVYLHDQLTKFDYADRREVYEFLVRHGTIIKQFDRRGVYNIDGMLTTARILCAPDPRPFPDSAPA
ncbi:MAG: hypothetical protein GC136_01940 [Alphaproteobacteria bacterium]|nr:hypothetical protein [Alphaproteobacteria bacterium]